MVTQARRGLGFEAASTLVANLGFLLQPADPSRHRLHHQLIVALRAHPTRKHFDPEAIGYWTVDQEGRGRARLLTRETGLPIRVDFSWGRIRLVDRRGVVNDFFAFGGGLTAFEADANLTLAVFASPTPIIRFGGHSQEIDRLAPAAAAFFGRAMVQIDYQPGAEEALSQASPDARYAAYLAFSEARFDRSPHLRAAVAREASLVSRETSRLRQDRPLAWEQGLALLDKIGLHP